MEIQIYYLVRYQFQYKSQKSYSFYQINALGYTILFAYFREKKNAGQYDNSYINGQCEQNFKKFASYYPRIFIAFDMLFNNNLSIFSFSLILILIVLQLTILVAIFKQQNYFSRQPFELYNIISDQSGLSMLVIAIMILIRCTLSTQIYLIILTISWYLTKFFYIRLTLLKKIDLQAADVAYYLVFGHIFNTIDHSDMLCGEPQLKIKETTKTSLTLIALKIISCIISTMYFNEKTPFVWIVFLDIEQIPIFISILQKSKNVVVVKKYLQSQREIIPFLKNYQNFDIIIIKKPENLRAYQSDHYHKLVDKTEGEEFELSVEEQMELLDYLRKQSIRQIIQIDQFYISISPNCYIVNKVVDMKTLYKSLLQLKCLPNAYLPPTKYLNLDITQLRMDRALMLQEEDRKQYIQFYQIYLKLHQQSFQIISFYKHLKDLIPINPSQVLYDLYEY